MIEWTPQASHGCDRIKCQEVSVKIIEAMKKVKANEEAIRDLQAKIALNSARLNIETSPYGDKDAATAQVQEWAQGCHSRSLENVRLLTAIGRTNLQTMVTITLGGRSVTKSVAEWIWRRRKYAAVDLITWKSMGDRNLKEGKVSMATGSPPTDVTIVRHYNPVERDAKVSEYQTEAHEIDAALEVINAVTDLVE